MKKPPLSIQLKIVMFICALDFINLSIFSLSALPVTLLIAGDPAYLKWFILIAMFAPTLFCSHTFARILVRRSIFSARFYIVVSLLLQALAVLLGWQKWLEEAPLTIVWAAVSIPAMVWLFVSLGRQTTSVALP